LHVPHLFDLEVTQTLRRYVLASEVSDERGFAALADLPTMRLVRYPPMPLAGRMWQLKENLTVYDAAYVALAEALEAPLLTADERLDKAPGMRAEVELCGGP
jgi:predicted nucleic acid-binding protein